MKDVMPDRSAIAKARWKLLAQALKLENKARQQQQQQQQQHGSVRNFSGFDLFERHSMGENEKLESSVESWKSYKLKSVADSKEVYIRFLENVTTAEDLIGFNNTGNVCIWPSEEVLAYYCWKHSDIVSSKDVIELGCGMSGLAGLYLAKNGNVKRMVLTDGNEKSIENLGIIIKRNEAAVVSSRLLEWKTWFDAVDSTTGAEKLEGCFDVVICADCLFFMKLHEALLTTIRFLMKKQAICILIAPRRSGTLERFVDIATKTFAVTVEENYDDFIWTQHQYYLQNIPSYSPDLHYPVLVTLREKK